MKKNIRTTARETSFEVLRILTMFLIVWNHFFTHGDWNNDSIAVRMIVQTFSLGKVGVDLFVLITGYFMYTSRFRSRSFFRTVDLTLFYAIVLGLVGLTLSPTNAVLGFRGIEAWFVTVYLCMYLFVPFLNIVSRRLTLSDFRKLLVLLLALGCVAPSILTTNILGKGVLGTGTQLPWFCVLYLIGSYIRRTDIKLSKGKSLLLLGGSIALLVLTRAPLVYLVKTYGKAFPYLQALSRVNHDSNFIAVLLLAVSIFLFFKSIHIKQHPLVNTLASTTFAVYLIHDNPLIRNHLWGMFASLQSSPLKMLALSIPIAASVFIVCSIIELCRTAVVRALSSKLQRQKTGKLDALLDRFDELMQVSFE